MTKRYAEGTDVSPERSRAEIESVLKKHGASQFFSGTDDERGVTVLGFRLAERLFRIEVRAPSMDEGTKATRGRWKWNETPAGKTEKARAWVDAELRRRWRVQLLLLKAKLEMVATGETTVEREFLADLVMPDGRTVGRTVLPAIAELCLSGGRPTLPLLGGGGEP
jgi:hypothetical protein